MFDWLALLVGSQTLLYYLTYYLAFFRFRHSENHSLILAAVVSLAISVPLGIWYGNNSGVYNEMLSYFQHTDSSIVLILSFIACFVLSSGFGLLIIDLLRKLDMQHLYHYHIAPTVVGYNVPQVFLEMPGTVERVLDLTEDSRDRS